MKLLLTLFLAAAAISGRCQKTADTSADCITNWRKGDTKIYSIVHEKTTARPGDSGTHFNFVYEAHITVLDATDEDYTIKWVFHVPAKANPGIAQPIPVFDGMQMIFRISSMGSFMELINWEEVRDNYATLDKTIARFNTKESVQSALIQEIQLFHLPYGYKFTRAKATEHTELSNPFGGDPLPAIQSSQLTQLDRQRDQFTLVIRQDIDGISMSSLIDGLLKKMDIREDKELQAVKAQLVTLEISDYSEYRFTWSNGWVRRLYRIRSAGSAGTKQTDAYTIELKD